MNPVSFHQPPLAPAESLSMVLGDVEHVKDLLTQSLMELTHVNFALSTEIDQKLVAPNVNRVLQQNQLVAQRVLRMSDKVASVAQALQVQMQDRRNLVQQLAAAHEQEFAISNGAMHDALTGLPNRVLFNDRLERGLAHARRCDLALTVMCVDLDAFQEVNDFHGHDAGNTVLQTIAERLQEHTREDDTVSRQTGDEFLFMFMGSGDVRAVARLAQKIGKRIETPCRFQTREISVKASIGIAQFPRNGGTADALVREADAAMFVAKRDRRGYAFAA